MFMVEKDERMVKLAMTAIVAFGFISLFGDIIYEGARSAIPTYLEILAAPAFVVGFAMGLGEFLGYGLRLISGYIADTTRAYWALTITGYALIISIPLLALTTDWRIAIFLVIIERTAKAIRTPARDTLISVTTKGVGRGKAFGLHELMDQIGATVGPAIMAGGVYYAMLNGATPKEQFLFAFSLLFIPYAMLLFVLLSGYLKMKEPAAEALQEAKKVEVKEKLTSSYYFYTLAVMLNTAGLFPIALIQYKATTLFTEALWVVPLLYLVVQGIDAVAAPLSGAAYDRYGIKVLSLPFILSVLPTLFLGMPFIPNLPFPADVTTFLILSVIAFGIILGMQESIYRAAVADLTGITKRGIGYGLFSTAYGLGFLIAGSVLGYLLDLSVTNTIYMVYAIIYTIVLQLISVLFLYLAIRGKQ